MIILKLNVVKTDKKVRQYLPVQNPDNGPPGNRNPDGPVLKNFVNPAVAVNTVNIRAGQYVEDPMTI